MTWERREQSVLGIVRRVPSFLSLHELLLLLLGVFLTHRRQWTADDGYIYFRYVDNLVVHGLGLVFNAGEFVEGYSSPLWVLLLSAVKAALPSLTTRQIVFVLGWAAALATGLLLIGLDRRLSRSAAGPNGATVDGMPPLALPLALAFGTQAVTEFFTSGMETPLVIVYTVVAARALLLPGRGAMKTGIVAGLGPLVRLDLGILSLAVLVAFALRERARTFAGALVVAAVPNLAWLAFRIWYYAALLPNPYYTKAAGGAYFSQGLLYAKDLLDSYPVAPLFAILAALTLYRLARRERDAVGRLLLLATMAAWAGYVLWVGGDFMHARFWLPLLLLLSCSFAGVGAGVIRARWLPLPAAARPVLAAAVALGVSAGMMSFTPVTRGREQRNGIVEERELFTAAVGNSMGEWGSEPRIDFASLGRIVGQLAERMQRPVTMPYPNIGYFAYHAGPRVSVIDLFGLTDPVVARLAIERRARPGHEKYAPKPYLILRKATFWPMNYDPTQNDEILAGFAIAAPTPAGESLPGPFALIVTDSDPATIRAIDTALGTDLVSRFESAARKLLAEAPDSANLWYFLRETYGSVLDPRTLGELDARRPERSAWSGWAKRNEAGLAILDAQVHNRHRLRENLRIALAAHRVRIERD